MSLYIIIICILKFLFCVFAKLLFSAYIEIDLQASEEGALFWLFSAWGRKLERERGGRKERQS